MLKSSRESCEVGTLISPILQMKMLGLREGKQLAQGHCLSFQIHTQGLVWTRFAGRQSTWAATWLTPRL